MDSEKMNPEEEKSPSGHEGEWDHSTHREFVEYYERQSLSQATVDRYTGIKRAVLRAAGKAQRSIERLHVADIGCGPGTQCLMWSESGHEVHGLDVSEEFVRIAAERADAAGLTIDFKVGSASELPWPDASMDVCLVPELLEHIVEWEVCLREVSRVLRPNGLLYISTTNYLCPVQQEFKLPGFSWYPAPLKRYFVELAKTRRPELANYATYPAVNWFSFYSMRRTLARMGFDCWDRFDLVDTSSKGPLARRVVRLTTSVELVRWMGHVATPATIVVALKAR